DLSAIRSVASFFVSRFDTEVDARLDRLGTPDAAALKGSAAIANARLAYQAYEQLTAGEHWQRLARLGARPQRPLWASTGVKNPAYPDTMTGSYDDSHRLLTRLAAAGIDFDDVTAFLERDGLDKFEKSWSELGATVAAELERQHHHPARSLGLQPGSPGGQPEPPASSIHPLPGRRGLASPYRQGMGPARQAG